MGAVPCTPGTKVSAHQRAIDALPYMRMFTLWIGSRRSQRVPSEKASGAEMPAYEGHSIGDTACANDHGFASSGRVAHKGPESELVEQPEQHGAGQFVGHLASRGSSNEHPFPAHGSRGDARTRVPADAMANGDSAPAFLGRRREC